MEFGVEGGIYNTLRRGQSSLLQHDNIPAAGKREDKQKLCESGVSTSANGLRI